MQEIIYIFTTIGIYIDLLLVVMVVLAQIMLVEYIEVLGVMHLE
jgi:hypothetical protein